jgi:hypothetical protein
MNKNIFSNTINNNNIKINLLDFLNSKQTNDKHYLTINTFTKTLMDGFNE